MEPVLVVGAGPTGLTVAILLAQRGVPVIVVERHAEPYALPRAVHLDDEGHRILQWAGVGDGFRAISRPALGLRIVDARLRTLAEFRRDSSVGVHGWPQANMFDQPALDGLLRDRLAELPQAELRTRTELVGLDPHDGFATLKDDKSQYNQRVRAVLGCDGANSTVRTLIGVRSTDLGYSENWLVVDAVSAAGPDHWPGVHQVSDPRRAATFMQVGANRFRWEFRLLPGETADSPDLAALLAAWTGGARVEILRRAAYTFRARIADRWRHGQVFLLGDAAHETPPFIGQGLGAGLRDAANLAWKLDLVLREKADDSLLDTYQLERRRPALRLIQVARLLGAAMTGGQDRAAAVRRTVLAAACRVPGFTAAGLRGIAPLVGPSALRPRWSRAPIGRMLPQPRVRYRGREMLLDEVLGPGFAVLTNAGPGSAGSGSAGSGSAGPGSAGPGSAGPGSAGPASAGPASAGPADAGSASVRPASAGSANAETVGAEATSAEIASFGSEGVKAPNAGPPNAAPPNATAAPAGWRRWADDLGARIIDLADIEDDSGTLRRWAPPGRTLVIRPDRLILKTHHRFLGKT